MAAEQHAKLVRSDLRDIQPSKRGAAFPHDLEATPKTRKNRRRKPQGSRSSGVPAAIPAGTRERRGGRDRRERKRR